MANKTHEVKKRVVKRSTGSQPRDLITKMPISTDHKGQGFTEVITTEAELEVKYDVFHGCSESPDTDS